MPYPPFTGTLRLNDPLTSNSLGNDWNVQSGTFSCTFTAGAYHSTTGPYSFTPCMAQNTDFSNFAYEVQMTILSGDCGGLLFRGNPIEGNYYHFRICQNGTCSLALYTNGQESILTDDIANAAIKAGFNRTNLLAVVANGSNLDFYVNQQSVLRISDSTYSSGQIGLFAGGGYGDSTETAFNDVRIWQL
jgi:hypothetical protein